MVSEYALHRILNGGAARVGGVDAWTRYYILHRWAYGRGKVPFDDAMRLAMALGADVSALMGGGSLEERLRERGSLPVDEAVRIASGVCEGLIYAHAPGIVHCYPRQPPP